MSEPNFEIALTKAEALVLFEFLARYKDNSELDIIDSSEETVLWKILGILESKLAEPFAQNYLEVLEAARSSLRFDGVNDS
jgi:hypothetical protein